MVLVDIKKMKLYMPSKLISAVIYLALIGVVLYGRSNHVYDGFGAAVPWMICAIFFATAVFSICSFIRSVRAQKSVNDFLNQRDSSSRWED